jgi:hypothetical protein
VRGLISRLAYGRDRIGAIALPAAAQAGFAAELTARRDAWGECAVVVARK